jgi:tRNA modification GTPase
LLGRERAIVSSTPGTTRDTIEEDLVIAGVPIRLIDTAGLRETDCEIEQIGITRTRAKLEQADVLLVMIDGSQPPDESMQQLLSSLPADRSLIVCNKIDLGRQLDAAALTPHTVIETSLKTDIEARAVREAIGNSLTKRFRLDARPHATISERHRQLLQKARSEVEQTLQLLQAGEEELVPLASALMRDALEWIGEVTGRRYHEELLDQIFARFCIGK